MVRAERLFFSWVVAVALGAVPAVATAQDGGPWTGLGQLRDVAATEGHPLRGGERVDLGVINRADGILLVGPHEDLPVGSLSAFLDAGGRLAVLDDFGQAGPLLAAYQIRREPAPSGQAVRLRNDPDLLVAVPATEHPLTQDVDLLLTNRAISLRHSLLKPVYTFARTEDALVLAGAVGAGRLVAVGDASLLINQHMRLPGHQLFARNLLRYLSAGGGEVWLVGPNQELFGTFGRPHRPGVQRLDAALAKLSHPDLPRWMLMALAAAGVAALVTWALGSLPKATPYLTPRGLPAPRVWAGFAGRIDSARHDGHNLLWAALDYRAELTAAVATALGVDEPPDARILVEAAKESPLTKPQHNELAALLYDMDALAAAEERPDELPRVDPQQLSHMVTTGERLLRSLEIGAA